MTMEPSPFLVEVSVTEMRRERQKARELRRSQWWKRKISSGVCHHCGGKFAPSDLTMDHLVPVVRGGKSTKGNVVPSCKRCNSARKHRLPFEVGTRSGEK
jgi:5-methylcytosine-specific restriction endonuclease McrA